MRKSALQVLITTCLIAAGMSAHAQDSNGAPPLPGGIPGAPGIPGTNAAPPAQFAPLAPPAPQAQYAPPAPPEAAAQYAAPPAQPVPPPPEAAAQYAPPAQPAPPAAAPYMPPSPGYVNAIREAIKRNIVWQGPRGNYETGLSVRCAPNGNVLDFAIARSSGNPQWDAAVISAVQKSSPLPVDESGKAPAELSISFRQMSLFQ